MTKETAFEGTDRYEVETPIGEGSYGIVYRAFDRLRREPIALKLLRRRDGDRLIAFKREFRALADVSHPNLVMLHELVSEGDAWFFTMELLEGEDFLVHIHPRPLASVLERAVATTQKVASEPDASATPPRRAGPRGNGRPWTYDEPRLREAFAQLVEGAHALHRSGQLHRDLKPSNALVTPEGRVVLLDFGLVTDVSSHEPSCHRIEGTVPYMSPEQCAGRSLSPASDFYSVGVMLYEALTGRWPFSGSVQGVIRRKQRETPPPPSEFVDVPAELETLCMRLLATEPGDRPDVDAILRGLGVDGAPCAAARRTTSRRTALHGREVELAALERAFGDVESGVPVALFVQGRSGMGKSALVDHYTKLLEREKRAVVLRGACYQRESVPYKALDSFMDALSSHLGRLPRIQAEQLMPREVYALARLFPVLERVASISVFPARSGEVAELDALRRRAVDALREIMSRMGDQRPLVMVVDDVQWGDTDSARLLRDLVEEGCPPVMMIFCCRPLERSPGAFLETLTHSLKRHPEVTTRRIDVGPLAQDASIALAKTSLSESRAPDLSRLSRQIAEESQGDPFFIRELADHVIGKSAGSLSSAPDASLSDLMRQRLAALDDDARRLLEVVSVAGRPVPASLAKRAAGLDDVRASTASLRGARLVRLEWQPTFSEIDTQHERVRDLVLEEMDPARLGPTHEALAEAHLAEADGHAALDVEAIARHYLGAGRRARAADYTVRAAARAFEQLAFERAAELYREAIELEPSTLSKADLHERLAEALARSGRGPEAAESYLRAVAETTAAKRTTLQCRAAEQYFFSGHIDLATDLFHHVLADIDLPPLPQTEAGALVAFLRRRAELKLRGLGFTLRAADRISDEDRVRTDVCYSVSAVLGGVRPLVASSLQTHHLLLALRLGDPFRLVRGLALEAIFAAMSGPSGTDRSRELLAKADEVAGERDAPERRAVIGLATGIRSFFLGQWRKAVSTLSETEALIIERCPGMTFELRQVQSFRGLALFYTGDYAEAGHRARPILKDLRRRGDRYAESMLVNVTYRHHLFAGRIDAAREEVARGLSGWFRGGTAIQDYYETLARTRIAIYEGDGRAADHLIDRSAGSITRSSIGRVQLVRLETHQLHGQAALLRAEASPRPFRRRLLERAEAAAWRLEREDASYGKPWAMLLRAGVAWQRGETAQARLLLADAEQACRQQDMAGFAAAARHRRVGLSDASNDESIQWMREQGITEPERYTALLVPGFGRRP